MDIITLIQVLVSGLFNAQEEFLEHLDRFSTFEETGVLQLNKSKIPCRPHKACIFLSNFMFFYVLVCNSVL